MNPEDLKNFLSFWVSTTATFRGHMATLNRIPAWLIAFTLASCWNIEMDPLHDSHQDDVARSRPLLPPSLRSLNDSGAMNTKITWGSDSKRPGNLDPTRGANEIHFTWRREVTPFTSDFNVYIWEQHKSWPAAEHAKVIFSPAEKTTDDVRLLVTFTNSRTLAALTKKRNLATVSGGGSSPGLLGIPSWSPVNEVVVSLCCIFEVMIADTAEFLGACHDEAMQMVNELSPGPFRVPADASNPLQNTVGRKNPSTSKLRFLMHLEDCRKVGHDGVRHGLEILEKLSHWTEQHQSPSAQPGTVFVDPFAEIWQDLEFFNAQFQQLQVDIQQDLEMLRGHFQLAQDLTLFRLTILAGIFLPLSFATSFFGMNMRRGGPPQAPEQSFSSYTNSTLASLPGELRNQTAALINTLDDNPQALTYSWETFAGTAAGLVLILPLTLTIGAIVRAIIKSITRYAIYWRIFMVFGPLLAFGFFVFSVWGTVIAEVMEYTSYTNWVDADYSGTLDFDGFGFVIAYWICNGLMLVGELSQTYRGWTTKQRPIFWTTLMFLTGACFGLDMTVWNPSWGDIYYASLVGDHRWVYKSVFRLMLLPWLFLGFDVGKRWRRSWLAQREGTSWLVKHKEGTGL